MLGTLHGAPSSSISSHCSSSCSIRKGSLCRRQVPRLRRMARDNIRAVKEKEVTLEEQQREQPNGKKPDMRAALNSAAQATKDKKRKSRSDRYTQHPSWHYRFTYRSAASHTNPKWPSALQCACRPVEQEQQQWKEKEPANKQVLFGPSSRLANTSATRKRKQPAEGKQRQQKQAATSNAVPSGDKQATVSKDSSSLDDLNPYTMGRRSRALLDNVWQRFTSLGSPGRVSISSNELDRVSSISGGIGDFETPQAAVTNILVLGATGKVGRILVRKLLLRGYPVTVLVRPDSPGKTTFPEAVKVVEGDVGDYATVRAAMQSVDKVVYCADARTTLTADVKRVCQDGVLTAAVALQDERNSGISTSSIGIQPFPSAKKRIAGGRESDTLTKRKSRWINWKVLHVGPPKETADSRSRRYAPTTLDRADLVVGKRKNLYFYGTLYSRYAYATAGMPIDLRNEGLAGTVGLVVRAKGDGQTYGVVLTTESGEKWMARFGTNNHFQNVRIPFSAFRRMDSAAREGRLQLDPRDVRMLSVSFENRGRPSSNSRGKDLGMLSSRSDREFCLELNRIMALPAGSETDFVLVSCAGTASSNFDPLQLEKVVGFKRKGEASLRTSGLGYTIVRPGPIIQEPGGYKALVFDQGERIRQSISRADVADVCLKSLHDSAARNKTFEVCHEYTPATGLETYELVAHLPNKANSYLTPALSNLETET